MKKIRILNDIDVQVTVYRDGAAEDLTGKTVTLTLATSIAKMAVEDFTVSGNVISFRFAAGQQKFTGVYRLTVQVADGEGNVNTVDKCDVFQLVKCSCEAGGEDDVNITTESVALEIAYETGRGGTTDYDALENKPSVNGVELTGDKTAAELGLATAEDVETVADAAADVSYTLDFGTLATMGHNANMYPYAIQVSGIGTMNVSSLTVSVGGVAQQAIVLTDAAAEVDITIASGDVAVWEIERITEGFAAVYVKAKKVMNN